MPADANPNESSSPGRPADSVRRRFFVSWRIQGRLLARLLGYWLVYHVVLWGTMFLYRYSRHFGEQLAGGPPRTFNELLSEFATNHYSLLVCAVAVLPLVLWDGIRTTHRIAGPLVRFQNALRRMARGEKVAPITLRPGDLPIELQDAFNEYLRSLENGEANAETEAADDGADSSEVAAANDEGDDVAASTEEALVRLDDEIQSILDETDERVVEQPVTSA